MGLFDDIGSAGSRAFDYLFGAGGQQQANGPPRQLRADKAPLALSDPPQRPGAGRSVLGMIFNPHSDDERELGRMALARIGASADGWSGMADAAAGSITDAKAMQQDQILKQKQALELQQLQQKVADGSLVEVGSNSGVYYDRATGKTVRPPKEAVEALREVTAAEAKGLKPGGGSGIQNFGQALVGPNGEKAYMGVDDYGNPAIKGVDGRIIPAEEANTYEPVTVYGTHERFANKQEAEYGDELTNALDSQNRVVQQLDLISQHKDVGSPGYLGDVARWAAGAFGGDVAGVDFGDVQSVENFLRNMEIDRAAAFKGQGQITESERKILRDSLPKLAMDPRASAAVRSVFQNVAARTRDIQNKWFENLDAAKPVTRQRFKAQVNNAWGDALEEARKTGVSPQSTQAWKSFSGAKASAPNTAPPATTQSPPSGAAPAGPPAGVQTTPSGRKWSIPSAPAPEPKATPQLPYSGGVGGPLIESDQEAVDASTAEGEAWRKANGNIRLSGIAGGNPNTREDYEAARDIDERYNYDAGYTGSQPVSGDAEREVPIGNSTSVVRAAPTGTVARPPVKAPPTFAQLDSAISKMRRNNALVRAREADLRFGQAEGVGSKTDRFVVNDSTGVLPLMRELQNPKTTSERRKKIMARLREVGVLTQ